MLGFSPTIKEKTMQNFNPLDEIKSVKIQGDCYLLNGTMSVPKADGNRECELIKEWLKIDGNTPEPEYTEAEIAEAGKKKAILDWKAARQALVDAIEVELGGVVYQGDEVSQTRMARAIVAMPDATTTIEWIAKDNTAHALTKADLSQILLLAGIKQAAIWNEGRPS